MDREALYQEWTERGCRVVFLNEETELIAEQRLRLAGYQFNFRPPLEPGQFCFAFQRLDDGHLLPYVAWKDLPGFEMPESQLLDKNTCPRVGETRSGEPWAFDYSLVPTEALQDDILFPRDLQWTDDSADAVLLESVKQHGVLVPIAVSAALQVVDGQKRLHAARLTGVPYVPCLIYRVLSEAQRRAIQTRDW